MIVQVVERVARKIHVVFGHHPKGADGGKGAAVFGELVRSLAIDNQLSLVNCRLTALSMRPTLVS